MRNFLLLGMALAICVSLMEVAVRVADPPLLHLGETVLLMSAVPQREAEGSLRFPPNSEVREAVVVGGRIEYDVRFHTNNFGRVDHRDYYPVIRPATAYALLGDSYAMGVEGGEPWAPKLRDAYGLELYNFGMGAVGVAEFSRIVRQEAAHLWFSDIVIVAISDDFNRPLFDLQVDGQSVKFLVQGESAAASRARPPLVHLVDFTIGEAGLLARAKQIRDGATAVDAGAGSLRRVLRQSKLLLFLKRLVKPIVQGRKLHSTQHELNLAALGEIRRAFPERHIRFIHVPDKFEVARGRYDLALADPVKDQGIEYLPALERCGFSVALFYTNDNHLNRKGYQHLRECVARLLELTPPSVAP